MLKIPDQKPQRYKILVGPHAGEIHNGFQIGARFAPGENVCWDKTSDRAWIPALNMSFLEDSFKPTECENLIIPFDKFGQEIHVGDYIYVGRDKGVARCKVLEMGKKYHQGCGWHTRILKVVDMDTWLKFSVKHPHEYIKTTAF